MFFELRYFLIHYHYLHNRTQGVMSILPEEGLDGIGLREDRFFLENYLDNPILLTNRRHYLKSLAELDHLYPERIPSTLLPTDLNTLTNLQKDTWNIVKLVSKPGSYNVLDPDEYPRFIKEILLSSQVAHLDKGIDDASDLFDDVLRAIDSWVGSTQVSTRGGIGDFDRKMSPLEVNYYKATDCLMDCIDKASQFYAERRQYSVQTHSRVGVFHMVTNGKMSLLRFKINRTTFRYALTWDQLLMFKDLMHSRAMVLSASRALYPYERKLTEAVSKMWAWQESCLSLYGNWGYEVLKSCEPLSKTYVSRMIGDEFGDEGPYERMVTKVRTKEVAISPNLKSKRLADKFEEIMEGLEKPQHAIELFGLQKLTGHPLIDPELGGQTVWNAACEPDDTTQEAADRVGWNFCRIFLENYVKKKHKWPNLEFSDKTTRLYQLSCIQYRNLTHHSYPLDDWSGCRFGKEFEVNTVPNYLELMDDKAISQYRSNIASNWDKSIEPISHRRLLLELISKEEVTPREILELVMKREIPTDWLIVCLYPKEREFKVAPRMFSMLVFEMRLFFTILQTNYSENILPYFPTVTMTFNQQEIRQTFQSFTRLSDDPRLLSCFFELDLEKWCSYQRELAVVSVTKHIDDLHGAHGLFTYTHQFFKEALMVVRVSDLPPEGINQEHPPETPLLHHGQDGGTEGIDQKAWSLVTASEADLVLQSFPVSYWILSQSDNVIIRIEWTLLTGERQEALRQMRDKILKALQAGFRSIFYRLKPEECLEFQGLITYSKDFYVHGVYHPTSLKFHSRLFPHASQDFPSVRSNVGAVFSTALAGAEKSESPLKSLYLAYLSAARYLHRVFNGYGIIGSRLKALRTGITGASKKGLIKHTLVLPSELGGFPIAPWTSFIYKGGSDPLGKSIASLCHLERGNPGRTYGRMIYHLTHDNLYDKSPKVLSLISDPYCIPLVKPQTPIESISRETISALADKIDTIAIKELLSESTEDYKEKLVEILRRMDPFNPLIAHDILDCSIVGVSEMVSKMFVATRTIQGIVRLTNVSLIPKIFAAEINGIEYAIKRWKGLPFLGGSISSITKFTGYLRRRWKLVIPADIEGLTTVLPFESTITWGEDAITSVGFKGWRTSSLDTCFGTRGPYDPYVGSKTREKRSEHGYKIISTDNTSRAFRKLQLILSQVQGNNEIEALINAVGLSRSNLILSKVSDRLPTVKGGTKIHRYASRVSGSHAYNLGNPNLATHCVISSDEAGTLSGGVEDYNKMIQEDLLVIIWLLGYPSKMDSIEYSHVCVRTDNLPLTLISERPVEIKDLVCLPILRYPRNSLAFLPHITIVRTSPDFYEAGVGIDLSQETPGRLDHKTKTEILYGWISNTLRGYNTGRALADNQKSLFPQDTLDIAEAVGCGLDLYIKVSANVIASTVLSDLSRTTRESFRRWDITSYLDRLAKYTSQMISGCVSHPLMRGDPGVLRHGIWDVPKYCPTSHHKTLRIKNAILNLALKMVSGSDEKFFFSIIPLFLLGSTYQTSEIKFMQATKVLVWAQNLELISNRRRLSWIRDLLLPSLRITGTDKKKTVTIDTSLIEICRQSQIMRLYELSSAIDVIRSGRSIHLYRMSPPEAIRLTRPTNIVTLGASTLKWTDRGNLRLGSSPRDLKITPLHQIPWEEKQAYHKTLRSQAHLTQLDMDLSSLHRHVGTSSNLRGSSGPLWRMVRGLFLDRHCVVIGAGLGVAAATALDGGATHVWGYDLMKDIPLEPHRYTSYVPYYIAEGQGNLNYTQLIPLTSSKEGWKSETEREYILKYVTESATVILDIESGEDQDWRTMLDPLTTRPGNGLTIWCTTKTASEWDRIVTDLSESGFTFRVVSTDVEVPVRKALVILQTKAKIVNTGIVSQRLHGFTRTNIKIEPCISIEPRRKALEDSTLGCYPLNVSDSLNDCLLYLLLEAGRIQGHYESRPSFDEWTNLMVAIVTFYWIGLNYDEKIQLIGELRSGQMPEMTLHGVKVSITDQDKVATHIIRYGSPLLQRVDALELFSNTVSTYQ